MISAALETILVLAHREAVHRRHGHLTLEHLLYATAHHPSGEEILRACGADLDRLRADLATYLESAVEQVAPGTPGGEVLELQGTKTSLPRLYKVLLHNDDYTTMEFVIEVLEGIFAKSPAEAFRIMMQVHENGLGVCGTYPFEIAETKVALVHERARQHGFPLRASVEEL